MILGYSRFAYVQVTDNMRQETFQQCHINAFEYFGGIPQTILYDNLKSIVIQRDKYGKNNRGFNNAFLDFSKTYKFMPKLCRPFRTKTKEGSGIEIDKEVLNAHLSSWLIKANNRIHSTTKEKPSVMLNYEKPFLVSLEGIIAIERENKKEKDKNKDNRISGIKDMKIDVSYFTTLNDYEILLQNNINNINTSKENSYA